MVNATLSFQFDLSTVPMYVCTLLHRHAYDEYDGDMLLL